MKIWFVTTKDEINILCPDKKYKIIKEMLFYIGVERIVVNSINDLHVIKNDDIIIVETKSNEIISWLNTLRLKHTGENPHSIKCDEDKIYIKNILIANNIPTPKHYAEVKHLTDGEKYFVKPFLLEDSIGIDSKSLCCSISDAKNKIEDIYINYKQKSIIEDYIEGYDCTVGIIKEKDNLLVGAIRINGNDTVNFLTENAKNADKETYRKIKQQHIIDAAIKTFTAIGAQNYARIDIRVKDNIPYILEVNLYPGLGISGYMYKCFQINHNTKYENFLLSIIGTATSRITH